MEVNCIYTEIITEAASKISPISRMVWGTAVPPGHLQTLEETKVSRPEHIAELWQEWAWLYRPGLRYFRGYQCGLLVLPREKLITDSGSNSYMYRWFKFNGPHVIIYFVSTDNYKKIKIKLIYVSLLAKKKAFKMKTPYMWSYMWSHIYDIYVN